MTEEQCKLKLVRTNQKSVYNLKAVLLKTIKGILPRKASGVTPVRWQQETEATVPKDLAQIKD